MIQKEQILLLFLFIYVVNVYGDNYRPKYSSCKRLENKIYQLTVTFPNKTPLYAAIRLLPGGTFDEIFSIANGNNAAELGANFTLSNRIGYYKCLQGNVLQLTGFGFIYKSPDISFLSVNGADVMHDYYFRLYNNDKTINGLVKFAVFTAGTNPFDSSNTPVAEGDIGKVKGELLIFNPRYNLANQP